MSKLVGVAGAQPRPWSVWIVVPVMIASTTPISTPVTISIRR